MRRRLLAPLAVVALLLTACSGVAGDDPLTVTAVFDDVLDLVPQAHVRAGDVPVGTVQRIELTEDNRARVVLTVRRDTGLPADTVAYLSKTSMLGERFVDLRPPEDGGTGRLEDGQEIVETRIVTDFEELVQTGSDVLAYLSADALAAAVQTGAEAFGGDRSPLGQFLTDVEAFVGRYEDSTDDLLALIDSLDAFTAAYARNADANAAVLADLEAASQAFSQVDDQLLDTLEDVSDLSEHGARVLEDNQEELENLIRRLRILFEQLTRIDGALEGFLEWFPRHNTWVARGEMGEEAQVYLDFIFCGYNETDGDPTRDCTPPNPGYRADAPGYYPTDERCWDDPDACPQSPQGGGG